MIRAQFTRFLSWLLWLANARMSSCGDRTAAYAIKERILRRWGTLVGEDIQHIKRECYGCDGSGYYESGEDCYHCGGTGAWDEKWIRLERWEFGAHIFHRPAGYCGQPMNGVAVIEGRIQHSERSPEASDEAILWLALIFDRRLFRMLLRSARGYRELWRPLRALQAITFEARDVWRRVYWRRECAWCHRHYVRLFALGSAHACRRCNAGIKARAAMDGPDTDDDLPF